MVPEKEAFFEDMENQHLALTYDDVRLRTERSHVPVPKIDTQSRFSRNVELKIPIISAAMDTVTTSEMAIAMAKLGGLGVIHSGLSIDKQREEVRSVKKHLNMLIEAPICVDESQTLESVLSICEDKNFDFRTFPVIDSEERLVGLLTQKDFNYPETMSVTVGSAMKPAQKVEKASANTTIKEAYDIMRHKKINMLPLVDDANRVHGLYIFSDVSRIIRGDDAQYNVDNRGRLRVAAAVPTDEEALERVGAMYKHLDVVVIDTAQGDSDFAFQTLEQLKEEFADVDIVVGNITSGASARALAEAGADGIKVGQGPGSICTTRVETGIGTPQVTAVYRCTKAIMQWADVNDIEPIPVCADGGIKDPGDISIAIAAGAHSVMMGNKLAGTTETPGDIITLDNGTRVKHYDGMGSPSKLNKSLASRKRYGVSELGTPLAEGIESYVPYRGSVVEIIDHYVKALRKSMAYVGAKNIEDHRNSTGFDRITNSGLRESHPHDVSAISK